MSHFARQIVSTLALPSLRSSTIALALGTTLAACDSDSPSSTSDAVEAGDGGGNGGGSSGTSGSNSTNGGGGSSSTSVGDAGPSSAGGSTADGGDTSQGPDAEAPTGADETCWFEDLGDWVVCEDARFPFIESVESTSTQDCAEVCLADPQCTAIYDYYWRGWDDFGCSLHLSTCDDPEFGESAEADGAKTFRKVCGASPPPDAIIEFEATGGIVVDADSGCVFRSPVPPEVCDTHGDPDLEIVGGNSLSECLELCQQREDCTAVKDKPEGDYDGMECLLHIAGCDELVPDQPETSEDLTFYYVKECDEASN